MWPVIHTELVKYPDAPASPASLIRSSSRTLMKTLTFGNLHPQQTHEIASPRQVGARMYESTAFAKQKQVLITLSHCVSVSISENH